MKAAAAQIQAIRAGEQKQKKKEDELAKILSDFIKSLRQDSDYAGFIEHISKLLALNLPAAFILVLIINNFPHLEAQTGLKMLSFEEASKAGVLESPTLPDLYMAEKTLPLGLKIAIDAWIQEISRVALDNRHRILERGLDRAQKVLPEIVDLMAFSLAFYLEKNGHPIDTEFAATFSRYCLSGIMEQVKKPFNELDEPLTSI
jgi:hypothetical protein